jgi:hypothetical protein
MNTFQLNGYSVRYFQEEDITYLVTSDANDAFGFKGDNTLLDKVSISVSTAKALHSHMDKPTLDFKNLPDRTLVIERYKALISVIRSRFWVLLSPFISYPSRAISFDLAGS